MKKEDVQKLEIQKETIIANFKSLNPELYEQYQSGNFIRPAVSPLSIEVSIREDKTNG